MYMVQAEALRPWAAAGTDQGLRGTHPTGSPIRGRVASKQKSVFCTEELIYLKYLSIKNYF